MSKFLMIAAATLMAVSAPSSAFGGNPNPPFLQDITEEQSDCSMDGGSGARGSIYDMAGPCGEYRTVVIGDVCMRWYDGEYIVAGSRISHPRRARLAQRKCRRIVNRLNS